MMNEKLGAATSNTSSSLSDVPLTSPTLLTARGDAADDDDDADMEDIVCPPPPPPPPTVSAPPVIHNNDVMNHKSRREIVAALYHLLSVYEKRRNKSYEEQYKSTQLYWSSIQNVLDRGIREVRILERAIRGQIAADQSYSKHMLACANSCSLDVDDCASGVGGSSNLEKGTTDYDNKTQYENVDSLDQVGNVVKNNIEALESEQEFISGKDSFLQAFKGSCQKISNQYDEHGNKLNKNCLVGLENLGYVLDDAILTVESMSQDILLELKTGNLNSTKYWNAYSKAVEPKSIGELDVWLHESRYRLSVACLVSCWKKCSEEMSKLFRFVKDIEVKRQVKLRTLVKEFCQQREYHWYALPSTSCDVLSWIVGKSENERLSIEKNLTQCVHNEAKRLERTYSKDKRVIDNDRDSPVEFKVLNFDEGESKGRNIELASPVASELLKTIKVLEKRNQSFVAKYKRTMAISTADGFLHFFDFSQNNEIFSNKRTATLSDVFNSFLPEVEVPMLSTLQTQEVRQKQKMTRNSTQTLPNRSWYELLKPTISLYLPNCKLHMAVDKKSGDCVAELTEIVLNVGAAKLFARSSSRLFYLRAENSDMLSKWISSLDIARDSV